MVEKHPDTEWLFGGEDDRNAWEAQRRFISPLFNGIYRQSVIGASHLQESDFAEFLAEARTNVAGATARLNAWVEKVRDQGGDFGDLVIDRLVARAGELDAETALGVVAVFAAYMDTYYQLRPKVELFVDTWEKTEVILRVFARSVEEFELQLIAREIATHAKSLSWMTNSIGRMDLWSHGLAGNRQREYGERLLPEPDLEAFLSILLDRIARLDRDAILGLPNLLAVCLTYIESPWHKARIKTIIRRFTGPKAGDEMFIRFLEATSGIIISSNRGVVHRISMTTLYELIGENAFERRWAALNNKVLSSELQARLINIKRMMDESKNW